MSWLTGPTALFANPASPIPNPELRLLIHHLYERLYVPEAVCERLLAAGISLEFRNVVGHEHPVVSDFLVRPDRLDEIHISIVGKRFLEVQETAFDVAEVNIENSPA